MFPHTITIYNKYLDAGTEKWAPPRMIVGVLWQAAYGANYRKTGQADADAVTLIIPKTCRQAAGYVPPEAWRMLPDKTGKWTLAKGDIIVKGACNIVIQRSSKELASLDDTAVITKADHKDFGGNMAHWEVGAK